MRTDITDLATQAASIVADAGGEIIGRTKLQKIAYFLEIFDEGPGFSFGYKHYGPYSDELTTAISYASSLSLVGECERPTSWGGFYSVFTSTAAPSDPSELRQKIIDLGKSADPVELELAATAAYFALAAYANPWMETERRKPEKATREKLSAAKRLYQRFRQLKNDALPELH